MAHEAGKRSDLLVDALALIRQDRNERRADCATLRDELAQALGRVADLQDRLAGKEHGLEQAETMYQFVEARPPGLGVTTQPGPTAPQSPASGIAGAELSVPRQSPAPGHKNATPPAPTGAGATRHAVLSEAGPTPST
ncbi:hypothetical protein [Streptomyces sp. NPDC088719]|uniref:hypothetical protein n=1 Tax=Streptomyces sp. NPDC088719 TaxID=3365872 RepID=UPI003803EC8A